MDEDALSPLHVASSKGHTAIIVALVEKGGADVNLRGGEMGETPLMLTVSNITLYPPKPLISLTPYLLNPSLQGTRWPQ